MNKVGVVIFFFFYTCILCDGQVIFQKIYGDSSTWEFLFNAQQTFDGGYFLAGATNDLLPDSGDFYFAKTDTIGNIQWRKTYGGVYFEQCQYAEQTKDSGYMLAGRTQETGVTNIKIWLIKTDHLGNVVWNKAYYWNGVSAIRCMHQTTDGGYVVLAETFLISTADFTVLKTDSAGNVVWAISLGNSSISDRPRFIQQTSDGGYILVGDISYSNIYLIKLRSTGTLQWWKSMGGPWGDGGAHAQETFDGGYIIAGNSNGFGAQSGDTRGFLIKSDSTGTPVWSKTYSRIGDEMGLVSVYQLADSGFIAAGISQSYNHLLRLKSNGDTLWTRSFGTIPGYSWGGFQTYDGGFMITAQDVEAGFTAPYLIKTDSIGNSICYEESMAFTTANVTTTLQNYPTPFINPTVTVTTPPINTQSNGVFINQCIPLNLVEHSNTINLNLSPNPASRLLTITDYKFAIKKIEVYNSLGEYIMPDRLHSSNNKFRIELDVSMLPQGIYFIKATTLNGIASAKFIKE